MSTKTLHLVFFVSLSLSFMKGADLILRPHQQKWLQGKLEIFTLRLNYLDVFSWYSKHLNSIFLKVIGLFSLLFITSFLHDSVQTIYSTAIQSDPILFLSTGVLSIFLGFRAKPLQKTISDYISGKDIRDNNQEYSIYTYIRRSFTIIIKYGILITLFFLIYYTAIYLLYKYYIKENIPIYIFCVISILTISIDFLGIILSLIIVLVLCFFIGVLHLFLKLLESILWRIVEYNKGAFAAINIIITFIIGVIELWLKQ